VLKYGEKFVAILYAETDGAGCYFEDGVLLETGYKRVFPFHNVASGVLVSLTFPYRIGSSRKCNFHSQDAVTMENIDTNQLFLTAVFNEPVIRYRR
jgi:hypothetical protein